MSLNKQQIEAIRTIQGPCLILAGAGSGKTTVIIEKIIRLINYYGYHPNEIFAVTFTNKAAQEMKNRIKKKIFINYKNNLNKLNIFTFHSLGMKIISKSLNILGYNKNYTLFDYHDQIRLIKNIVSKEFRHNNDILKKIIKYISFQKNKIYSPKKSKKKASSKEEKIFSEYYQEYNNFLKKYNVFDFDDLIYVAVYLLKKCQKIKEKWQNCIKYLLVDEYQDTNYSQYKLIKLLSGNNSNFTLVGDDDQSIYSWRGANVENLLFLKNDYPKLQVIKMERNYRSSKRILKVANILISNNQHIFKKKLFSTLEDGIKIKILKLKNEYDESETIISKILLHKLKNNLKYKDYVILYRKNQQSKIFEKNLFQKQIPYVIHENNSFFNKPDIRNLISYLKFIINQDDNISFLKIINIPSRGIGISTIKKIIKYSKYYNKNYYFVIQDINFQKILRKNTRNLLNKFIKLCENIILFSKKNPKKILYKIINDIKYKEWLLKNNKNIKNNIQNIEILLNLIDNYFNTYIKYNNIINSYEILIKLINQLSIHDTNINVSNKNNDYDAIQLMTIHASKGLEFPIVFIIGFEEGIIPSYHNVKNKNISEERRLVYVAITRAKKELIISFCNQRYYYGSIIDIKPSRFLFELPKNDLLWENYLKE
ncbi:UvrD-helicase domain-containing protein [Buchnera aphidicola]|uniref:DNA 3'-5' helicase n=1 Tax=Buchnera aphidicola (Therioaphis trifolii) TaxID=1241884 RepID=A0A4D6YE24_9GAMM|nr:UvrD-helicase domain-containing protein [Buchnera aphidicola]QCI27382.1 ATP-dependent DNA helicase Rep [Buchnera aphidicola (Therioaphis trifolii)]